MKEEEKEQAYVDVIIFESRGGLSLMKLWFQCNEIRFWVNKYQ
jgi:hypothetical protein